MHACVIITYKGWVPYAFCPVQSYDFVELWAGQGMASTMVQKSGRAVAALDINYFQPDPQNQHRSNHFDMLTNSGFMSLGCQPFRFEWLLYDFWFLCWQ